MKNSTSSTVELYWIPLGAGAHVVRLSGLIFEAITAFTQRRSRKKLYHSALQVFTPEGRYVIEQTPVVNNHGNKRGVVAEGPVMMKMFGLLPVFRYEIRCWKDGVIPDIGFAVNTPRIISDDHDVAQAITKNINAIPTPVWGRDTHHTGDMWNSNSVISWVLEMSGIDTTNIHPPTGGRAPGWKAGIDVAHRNSL